MGAAPELDAEDLARIRVAETKALGLTMNALRMIPQPFWGRDSEFIGYVCRQPPDHLTDKQREQVARVAWRLRRYLPQHLKPRLNPDDPIVREMALKERLHAG